MKNRCRRDKFEIAEEILKKAIGGVKKTNIMYRCNLSPKQNEEYLQALLGSGFLYLASDCQYITTPEGRNAIRIAEETRKTFSEFYERLRKK